VVCGSRIQTRETRALDDSPGRQLRLCHRGGLAVKARGGSTPAMSSATVPAIAPMTAWAPVLLVAMCAREYSAGKTRSLPPPRPPPPSGV